MGSVSFGAPREIIQKIRTAFRIGTFVETGTYMGGTAAWASEYFEQVFTIEGSPEFRQRAQESYPEKRNIEFLLGDSRSMLRAVISRLGDTPALFWLDAHWMPGSFGELHECPLLEEIDAIHGSSAEHFILIDDARLFLAPPPLPHRARDWPDIGTVLSALNIPGRPANYTVVYNDVIISLPGSARETMQGYYQEQVTRSLQPPPPPVSSNPLGRVLGGIKRRMRAASQAVTTSRTSR